MKAKTLFILAAFAASAAPAMGEDMPYGPGQASAEALAATPAPDGRTALGGSYGLTEMTDLGGSGAPALLADEPSEPGEPGLTREIYKQNFKRWYVQFGMGYQVYNGKNDFNLNFFDRFAPAVEVSIGRKFTNVISVDVTYLSAQFRGLASPLVKDARFNTGEIKEGKDKDVMWYIQKGYMLDLYLRFMVDLTNWWGGVNPSRASSVNFYAGSGWASGYGCDSNASSESINAGFIYGYHFNQNWSLDLTVRGSVVGRQFEGEHCDEHLYHGFAGFDIGFRYRF